MNIRLLSVRLYFSIFSRQAVLRLGHSVVLCSAAGPLLCNQVHAAQPYYQDSGEHGLVAIEAEEYHAHVAAGTHAWTNYAAAGHSGAGALMATPNNGAVIDTNYEAGSPRLDYKVHFNRAGVHYLWVRSLAPARSDDTLHAGLNGDAVDTASGIALPRSYWGWGTMLKNGGGRAVVKVPSAGLHTVNLWMREDGAAVDKLVLTPSSDYFPRGLGPGQSLTQTPPEPDLLTVSVSWESPSQRQNGTQLEMDEIGGYEVHYGLTPALSDVKWVEGGQNISTVLRELPRGETLYVAILIRDNDGMESELSDMVQFSLR